MKKNTKTVNDDFDFGVGSDFVGSTVGAEPERKWQYPTIGYSAQNAIIYMDNEEIDEFAGTVLAIRQCKEVDVVTGRSKQTFRYPLYEKRENMVTGDEERVRLQALIWANNQLYVFGGSAWTMRAAFVNPKPEGRSKEYSTAALPIGVWIRLNDYIAKVKKETGVITSPLCYILHFEASEDMVKLGEGNKSTRVHPLIIKPAGTNDADTIAKLESLYVSEDVKGWTKQWGSASVEEADDTDDDVSDSADDDDEGDEIPF